MAIDRQGTGLAVVRVCLGIFFLFEGIGKARWFVAPSVLASRLAGWHADPSTGALSHWYLEHVALPGVATFARLVPLGELAAGVAFITGVWTPVAAFLAFLMVLNIHIASGALLRFAFLTNPYGLPVLGSTLGLAIGGVRLPWRLRR